MASRPAELGALLQGAAVHNPFWSGISSLIWGYQPRHISDSFATWQM